MYNEYSNLTNYGSLEGISEIIIDNGVMNDMILEDIATIESLNYLDTYGQSDVTTVAPLLALENLYYVGIYDWTNITDVESLYALEVQLATSEGFVDYNEIYYPTVEDGTTVATTSNDFVKQVNMYMIQLMR